MPGYVHICLPNVKQKKPFCVDFKHAHIRLRREKGRTGNQLSLLFTGYTSLYQQSIYH